MNSTRLRVRKTAHGPTPLEEEGDIVAIGTRNTRGRELSHAVYSTSCEDTLLDNVTVYASNCFAFLELDCHGVTYEQCRVEKRDARVDPWRRGVPRVRSANADAFHSKRASAGPKIIGCYAHHMGDDCVNICGDYHLVASATDTKLRVLAKNGMDIVEGDLVELVTFNGGSLTDARVVSMRELGALTPADRSLVQSLNLHQSFKDHKGGHLSKVFELILDRAVSLTGASLVSARERQGQGFLVAECDFGHIRSRGILIKASDGEVRDNTLTKCRMESIKVAPEFFWLESGSSCNVKIMRNTVLDCGGVAIAVYALGGDGEFAAGTLHRGIWIVGNRIYNSPLPNVLVTSTSDLVVTGNRLSARKYGRFCRRRVSSSCRGLSTLRSVNPLPPLSRSHGARQPRAMIFLQNFVNRPLASMRLAWLDCACCDQHAQSHRS